MESSNTIHSIHRAELMMLKLAHYTVSIVLFQLAWSLFRYGAVRYDLLFGQRYDIYVVIAYGAVTYFFYRTYNSYLLGYYRIRSLASAQIMSQLFGAAITYAAVSLSWARFDNPMPIIAMLITQFMFDMVWSYCGNVLYFKLNPTKKTILIYRDSIDRKRFGSLKGKPSEKLYEITQEIMYDGSFNGISAQLMGYDAIFVAGVNSRCRNGILKYCKENGIPGFFLPHVGDVIMQEATHIQSFDSPVLFVERKVLNPEYYLIKRAFDIAASFLGIVVLSPLFFVTALAIKLYDGGPVLYKQVRLTKDERRFTILKFRSMRVDAEKDGIARLSTGDHDDRITPIGKIVRKCRLDELPQLINILKGDMTIVGPRPERPEIAEQYYKTMPDFRLRLQVKAGLTGYAQIYGKYNTDPYEKLEFDLLYINSMSVLTDLKLIFATVSILLNSDSTEGVAEGSVTAARVDDRIEVPKDDTLCD